MAPKQPPFEPSLKDLESGLAIDEYALDEELRRQPDLLYRVSKRLTLAISRRDEAKTILNETEAEVELTVRLWARKKEMKITDKEVEARRRTHPDVRAAHEQLLQLNRKVGTYNALKESYTAKQFAVQKMCDLYLGNYFAERDKQSSESHRKNYNAEQARRSRRER